mmetsp:Transcript_37333/g.60705  ORF Transcript_37333/g.60705 Transcript_37333/m.60705 type:complete len:165 (+) Transcript_37333:3362-3856(+)
MSMLHFHDEVPALYISSQLSQSLLFAQTLVTRPKIRARLCRLLTTVCTPWAKSQPNESISPLKRSRNEPKSTKFAPNSTFLTAIPPSIPRAANMAAASRSDSTRACRVGCVACPKLKKIAASVLALARIRMRCKIALRLRPSIILSYSTPDNSGFISKQLKRPH